MPIFFVLNVIKIGTRSRVLKSEKKSVEKSRSVFVCKKKNICQIC